MAEGGPLGLLVFATILALIGVLAFSIRLFSVIKYESIIHEFDPYFNYRVTQYLTKAGIYEFWNWFDDRTWYPLGRVIGGTVYPGLTLTAGTMWWLAQKINIPLSVETVCVFTAPIFSAFASWATLLLTKEVKGTGAGLTAAVLLAMVPSYISRSVAGSYDNEAVAIFALVFTFFLYVKTLNTGSLFYATLNSLSYFYMVCSWGGYTFIINLIPIHVLMCLITGRYSARLYIAYAPLVVLGTLLAALVPVVGFNAVMTSEHFASFLVFVILNIVALERYIRRTLDEKTYRMALTVVVTIGTTGAMVLVGILIALVAASPTKGWSGRSLSLLDPTDENDKVASWWDYGYQTTAMANRTVIVDNNTWNNTHIATVGMAISSPEKAAWDIYRSLDVKYVFVVFGGLVGYPSDDINKFLWMVRIGGGVFPHIKEPDYLRDGNYRIDDQATPTMLNSLMYKLSYYRFAEASMDGKGFDRVRRTEIGRKHFKLTHFEEVFTTHHWMVRIYKLKEQKNRVRGKIKRKTKGGKSTSSSATKKSASKGRS